MKLRELKERIDTLMEKQPSAEVYLHIHPANNDVALDGKSYAEGLVASAEFDNTSRGNPAVVYITAEEG